MLRAVNGPAGTDLTQPRESHVVYLTATIYPASMRHRTTVALLGLGASAAFLYLAIRRLDYGSLLLVLSRVQVWPWLPLGILAYLCGHVVRGLRCRLLLRGDANLRPFTAANVVVVGYAANNVFPARLGELVRAGMLSERTGVPIAQSLTVTFIERVLDGLAILLLLVVGVSLGGAPPWAHELVRVALLVFGSALGWIVLAGAAPGLLLSLSSRIGSALPGGWHDRLVNLATSVTRAAACLRGWRQLGVIAAYSVLVWVLESGLFLAILPALGLPPSASLSAVAMSVTNLGLLVPSSPGFIGPFHYFCSRVLVAEGVGEATAVAYATVVHLAFYVPVTLWGALAMLWYGVQVGATVALSRAARSAGKTAELDGLLLHELGLVTPPARESQASAFTYALVEAFVVPTGQRSDTAALNDVADFVHGQIRALRPRLRILADAGLIVFRVLTRLRYLRGFCKLSLETRRAWVSSWADGPFALLRQLMKPFRATALLAFYDHPTLRAPSAKRLPLQPPPKQGPVVAGGDLPTEGAG